MFSGKQWQHLSYSMWQTQTALKSLKCGKQIKVKQYRIKELNEKAQANI